MSSPSIFCPSRCSRNFTFTNCKRIHNPLLIYIRFRARADYQSWWPYFVPSMAYPHILVWGYQPCLPSFGVFDLHIVMPLYSSLSIFFLDTCPQWKRTPRWIRIPTESRPIHCRFHHLSPQLTLERNHRSTSRHLHWRVVDNLKVSKVDSDDGSNCYEKMEETEVGDRDRLGSTWIHGEPPSPRLFPEMLTSMSESNVGYWINQTA